MFNKTPQDLQNIIKHLPEGMSLDSEFCCLKSHFYINGLIIQSRNSSKCFPRFYNKKKCTDSWRLNCIGIDEKCTSSVLKLDCNYFIGKRLAAHWIKLKKPHLTFLKKEYIHYVIKYVRIILDWTVCQVSMVTNPQVPDQMILSSMRRDQEPVIVRLPAFQTVHVSPFGSLVYTCSWPDSFKVKLPWFLKESRNIWHCPL